MRNRIWYEMAQAKFSVVYTSLLYEHHKKRAKWYNISIIILSAIGALGWDFWEFIPVIACGAIVVMSLMKELKGEIILSDKQFESLNKIQTFYMKYLNDIESLWYKLENGTDNNKVHDLFHKLRKNESEITSIVNENITSNHKRLYNKASIECDRYFTNHFKTSKI